jgi:NTE family protein
MASKGRKALVLAGGGITGYLFEVGVLAAYDELGNGSGCANDFDVYVGTSAGSVLASLLANGASPRDIFQALSDDKKDSPFFFEGRDIIGVGAAGVLGLLGQFLRAGLGTVRRAVRAHRWPSSAELLADFQEHHPPGFYSTEALAKTLCERFTALGYRHHFSELPHELYVSGTDIDTGEHLVFGGEEFQDVHICRAVAASCALPIFFRPIRIGERDVVDGGVSEGSPAGMAVERGAREILFINPLVPIRNDRAGVCLPRGEGYCARLGEKGVGWIGEQTMRLMRAQCLISALEAVRLVHEDVRVILVEPGRDEIPMFMQTFMSFAGRKDLLTYGYETGRKFFRNPSALKTSSHENQSALVPGREEKEGFDV